MPNENQLAVLICIFVGKKKIRQSALPRQRLLSACKRAPSIRGFFHWCGPGATGECWEYNSAMSNGNSLPEELSDGERLKKGGRWLTFTLYRYCTNHSWAPPHPGRKREKKKNSPYGSSFFLIRSLIRLGWGFWSIQNNYFSVEHAQLKNGVAGDDRWKVPHRTWK